MDADPEAIATAKGHHRVGRLGDAEQAYRRALRVDPANAEAHHLLGIVCRSQGRAEEAVGHLREAARLSGDAGDAANDLGVVLAARGDLSGAVAVFERSLDRRPDDPRARNNLRQAAVEWGKRGVAQARGGDAAEAVASFREGLRLRPDSPDLHCNLGVVLEWQGDLDGAEACQRRALGLDPAFADALGNLGNVLAKLGRINEAVAALREAIARRPDYAEAWDNLLYLLNFSPDHDGPAILAEHEVWAGAIARGTPPPRASHGNDRTPGRRLRVGYVSPDFGGHCQAFFTLPLLSAHDRGRFEIIAYADVARPDPLADRLRSRVDLWRDVHGLADDDLARRVTDDRVDVLVDLTLHMARNRLRVFARCPAPVQVSWLGYPGTTGLAAVAYRLSDPHLDPPGRHDGHYSEETLRLPDAFWCYDPLADGPDVGPLPALADGRLTFGSLNNFMKVNDDVLRLWARVLSAVDNSRMLLLAPEGSARSRVVEAFAAGGVSSDRLEFVDRRPRPEYLAAYRQIDLALDTFPANGHTTSLDGFWMGVPVVTLAGRTAIGRGGVSQLTNLGLDSLIAETPDAFVATAARVAADLPALAALRASLRGRLGRSPLMDAPRFARNVEAAYRGLWTRWCAGG